MATRLLSGTHTHIPSFELNSSIYFAIFKSNVTQVKARRNTAGNRRHLHDRISVNYKHARRALGSSDDIQALEELKGVSENGNSESIARDSNSLPSKFFFYDH